MQRSALNSPDPWVLLVLCKRCWLLQCSLSCKSSARNGNWFGEYSVQENTFNKQSFIGTLLCLVPELSECLTTGEALHQRSGKGHRQDWGFSVPGASGTHSRQTWEHECHIHFLQLQHICMRGYRTPKVQPQIYTRHPCFCSFLSLDSFSYNSGTSK